MRIKRNNLFILVLISLIIISCNSRKNENEDNLTKVKDFFNFNSSEITKEDFQNFVKNVAKKQSETDKEIAEIRSEIYDLKKETEKKLSNLKEKRPLYQNYNLICIIIVISFVVTIAIFKLL